VARAAGTRQEHSVDYLEILKKAWQITWRYKMLWVLGLFAGAASGGNGGGNTGYQMQSEDIPAVSESFSRWVGDNAVLLVVIAAAAVIIGIVFFVLSIAAQDGLVYGSNEAAEGRTPSLGRAWSTGFGLWGRTFMIGLVLALPIVLIVGFLVAILISAGIGSALTGESGIPLAVGGLCIVLPVSVVLLIAGGIILGIVYQLALRHGVLNGQTFGQAIRSGWNDLWEKKGAFVFWLVMIVPGMVYGIALLVLIVPFAVGAAALGIAGQWVIAGGLFVLLILLMMLPNAIYATFVSTSWTVFFRRMTGMEETVPVAAAPAFAPPAPPVMSGD
jgi:hypothetical protein